MIIEEIIAQMPAPFTVYKFVGERVDGTDGAICMDITKKMINAVSSEGLASQVYNLEEASYIIKFDLEEVDSEEFELVHTEEVVPEEVVPEEVVEETPAAASDEPQV